MRLRRTLLALLAPVIVLGAGCGSSSSTTTEPSPATTGGTGGATTGSTSSGPSATDVPGKCPDAATVQTLAAKVQAAQANVATDPQAFTTAVQEAFTEYRTWVPDELKAQYDLFVSTYLDYLAVAQALFTTVGTGTATSDQQAQQQANDTRLKDPTFVAAQAAVNAYFKQTCPGLTALVGN